MTMNTNKKLQQGSTLVEILISMIILSISIVSFISLEIKTFSNINDLTKEIAIVNAIYNLSQNMLINPILNPNNGSKNYSYYNFKNNECLTNSKQNTEANLSKENFAKNNLIDFCNDIANIYNLSLNDINVLICNNDNLETLKEQKQIRNNNIPLSCNNNGKQTVIKVLWQVKSKNKQKYKKFYYSIALN